MYIPLIVSVVAAVGVNVTEHVPAIRVQLAALKVPVAVVVKLTDPVGVVTVPTEMSATVALQVDACPTTTGVVHDTVVDVFLRLTTIEPDPELAV